MRAVLATFAKFLLVACAGAVLGLFAAHLAIERGVGFNAVEAGPWTAQPRNGTDSIDPYARATLAHSGELPLGASEGLSFVARGDSSGARFDPRCDYLVSGEAPPARYWTLTLHAPSGLLVANKAMRNGFTSAEILRAAGGGFAIAVARAARPGNWLPVGAERKFILILRLYDTEIGAVATALDESKLPRIAKVSCS